MKRFATACMLCLMVALWTPAIGPAQETAAEPPAESPAESNVQEIRLTIKKYEYQPNVIHVKEGERVRLILTALDRKHGFELKEWKIKTEMEKGEEAVVEFVASRSGEFEFKCSVFCGFGHGRVKGKLIVEPADTLALAHISHQP